VDNGVFDLGEALPAADLVHAARAVRAQETILPDVMHDGPTTIRASDLAARQILEITDELRLCAVVHAADDREWHQVYDHFASRDYTGAIAFPASRSREPSRELPKNRVAATAYLEENGLSSPGCRRALSLPCRGGPSLVPVAWFTLICLLPARPVLAPR
jgi:hypothetical protein